MRYAEVIGDPIAQSKSPIIHKTWLAKLGIDADYRPAHVGSEDLKPFLEQRRADPEWCGCNVTIPHKETAAALVDRVDASARAIGAVNCIVPEGGDLVGYNSDIDGVAVALGSAAIRGRKAAIIGAGGAARAAVSYLSDRDVGRLVVLARNPHRAESLEALLPAQKGLYVFPFEMAKLAVGGATVVVNASPLGMADAEQMPEAVLEALALCAPGATLFDMVTTPSATQFLAAGAAAGGSPVDGLTMLIGQAARAFGLFFGAPAPPPDPKLRDLLTTGRPDLA